MLLEQKEHQILVFLSLSITNLLSWMQYFMKGLIRPALFFSFALWATGCSRSGDAFQGLWPGANFELDRAVQDFDQALQLYPRCTMAFCYKGEAMLRQGYRGSALESLRQAGELLEKGIKKTAPYFEAFDEVHPIMIEDLLKAY